MATRSFESGRGLDKALVALTARLGSGNSHASCSLRPRRRCLRHRCHRIRHHGSAARCQQGSRRLDLGRRTAHFGLCARRRHWRAFTHHRHRQLATQDCASGADGDLHAGQSRLRAGARLLDADGRPHHHRFCPRHLLRRRLCGRHRPGRAQQEGFGDRIDVHRAHHRQHPRRALRHLARPGLWLARHLLGGDPGRPGGLRRQWRPSTPCRRD